MATETSQEALSHNMTFLWHSDLGGRPSAVQVMVYHDHAYLGQARYGGFSILDVRNPRDPKPAAFVPTAQNTWNLHLQVHENLLLVVDSCDLRTAYANQGSYYSQSIDAVASDRVGKRGVDFMAGMRIYDLATPAEPRQIGYLEVEGLGLHRIWYDGGRYAYASALLDG